jgi:DNA-binding GntR family transcriptional regulator
MELELERLVPKDRDGTIDRQSPGPTADGGHTLGERAATAIRELIVSGELAPGTRVSHDELAAKLGISRLPLRDAFIMLEREGWVVVRRGRGTYLSEINTMAVMDNFALYGLLLGLAVERAIQRGSSDLPDRLSRIRDMFNKERSPSKRALLAIKFNREILNEAHSERLRSSLRALRGLPLGDFYRLLPAVADVQKSAMGSIIEGIRARNASQAADAYAELMRRAGEGISGLLRDRGLLNDESTVALGDKDAAEAAITHFV